MAKNKKMKKNTKKNLKIADEKKPAPVINQIIRPPLRNLVIETDGDQLFLRSCTMPLIELSMCLQMLTRQVENEQRQKAAPPTPPVEQPASPDAQPAEEALPTPEE